MEHYCNDDWQGENKIHLGKPTLLPLFVSRVPCGLP